ncbi:hypothetical protein PAXRUDRAFT_9032 [Paxillus rubicundulus Ve08.2h10]|uniref:Uncharacterized protein n=1 Tax=Paxillus rubicundulus Ve08.2h10 TaxID=930991 RepID=A0A0D0E993_9AGAM|nr:hypothetical protein PAXRUDRAFT_9032 [Paxillus rubicundulus Ve08.2h10]
MGTSSLNNFLKGHSHPVKWATFTPDGQQLVTAGDDMEICLWDTKIEALRVRKYSWGGGGYITRPEDFGQYISRLDGEVWGPEDGKRNLPSSDMNQRSGVRRFHATMSNIPTTEFGDAAQDKPGALAPAATPPHSAPGAPSYHDHDSGFLGGSVGIYSRHDSDVHCYPIVPSTRDPLTQREKAKDQDELNTPRARTSKRLMRFGQYLKPPQKP